MQPLQYIVDGLSASTGDWQPVMSHASHRTGWSAGRGTMTGHASRLRRLGMLRCVRGGMEPAMAAGGTDEHQKTETKEWTP